LNNKKKLTRNVSVCIGVMRDSDKWKKEIVYVRDTTFGRRHGRSGVGWIVVNVRLIVFPTVQFQQFFFSKNKKKSKTAINTTSGKARQFFITKVCSITVCKLQVLIR